MNKGKLQAHEKLRARKKALKSNQKGKTRKEILAEMVDIEKTKLMTDSILLEKHGFKPGVYFLFSGMDLVYIGESQCMMSRICQHYGQKNFDSFRFYAIMPEESQRKKLERKLIRRHRPILNSQHNDNMIFKEDKRQLRG